MIEALKDAFVQGRLTRDELGARAGRALAAQTGAELAALTADIPAEPAAAGRRARRPRAAADSWPRRPPGRAAAWSSRSPPCGSPPTSTIRMASNPYHPRISLCVLVVLAALGGTVHLGVRGGHLIGAETLSQTAAAPPGAGPRRPGRRGAGGTGHDPVPPAPAPTRPAPTCGLTSHASTGSILCPGRAGHRVS